MIFYYLTRSHITITHTINNCKFTLLLYIGCDIMNYTRAVSIFIFKIIPKSLISRIFGCIARITLPHTIMNAFIQWYSGKYGVKEEYITPAGGFKNVDQFFTRRMKDGVHIIDRSGNCAVSPVDARIDQLGDIHDTTIIQAKGMEYSLRYLVPSETYRKFLWGKFMTLYLSPGDYHRIHSPVDGTLVGYFNIPGKLFTVQDWMVQGLPSLFAKNERILSFIELRAGTVAVCKIGALNVGRIALSYCNIRTNRTFRRRREVFFTPEDQVPVHAGDELGVFHMGSTIILLFQKGMITFDPFKSGEKIRMGNRIGILHD
jgi:phosphatidylserine decarboxylase